MRHSILLALLVAPWAAAAQTEATPPVVSAEPPMQWVLTGGRVVVGTRVSEDVEFYVVHTEAGLVRIRKIDVARIELRPVTVPPPPPPAATAAPAPAAPSPPARSNVGARLVRDGGLVFLTTYAATAFIGALIAAGGDSDGNWLLLPVLGPILWISEGGSETAQLSLYAVLSSLGQAGGLVAFFVGLSHGDDAGAP